MKEFEIPTGTWPSDNGMRRLVRRANRMIGRIENILEQPRAGLRLLDVGCSSGAFVHAATVAGCQTEGVEPSEGPTNTALARGLKVHRGYLEDLRFAEESFHAVTLVEVIEHLRLPVSLLLECRRILIPGGLLIIRTGNTDSWTAHYMKERWEYFDTFRHGGHVSFFNPFSIRELGHRCGFSVVDMTTRKVKFHEKGFTNPAVYQISRLLANSLNRLSILFEKGHEMTVVFRKN